MVLYQRFILDYEGAGYSNDNHYYQPNTKRDFLDWFKVYVEDNAEESYDTKVFAILSTPSIRDNLDFDLLCRVWEEISWKMYVCVMFEDDDEGDVYNKLYAEIEKTLECEAW